ncbi:protein TolQ [Rickettsiales endosymbiont of Stachyamoeba lipophora]|uniref:protein TolQ n=1 Tax=Rickettsiales endosymbiont of Stachyamoeba lipophora TaxID=2486578 RepID=UPI001F49D2AB|nr:protein TolQ [Rickettsiales endosymbiont of Stachyamoeba lipophora]
MSILSLVARADIVVQLVMLALIICSVWCWAILFEKWLKYKAISIKTDNFEKKFWSGQVLDQLYDKLKNKPGHPMASVFCVAMDEWSKNKIHLVKHNPNLKSGIVDRLKQAMNVSISRETDHLSTGLPVLASVGSYAPFLGLFGTVWGIMHSFQSIAASKNSSLAVVAPGIAEALLATAIGLFAAIPAVIFYNMLTTKLGKITAKLDDFSAELTILLSRELDESI